MSTEIAHSSLLPPLFEMPQKRHHVGKSEENFNRKDAACNSFTLIIRGSIAGRSSSWDMKKRVQNMKRFGQVIKVKPEKLEEYKYHHANPWPEINHMIKQCNIQNYSIYYRDGHLFAYYEYIGENYEEDMAKMAADLKTQEWWDVVKPCQEPLENRKEGEWWSDMEEVYHLD